MLGPLSVPDLHLDKKFSSFSVTMACPDFGALRLQRSFLLFLGR